MKKQQILDIIDAYFDRFNNADEIVCGCGCKQTFDLVHGVKEQYRKGLKRCFKEEK